MKADARWRTDEDRARHTDSGVAGQVPPDKRHGLRWVPPVDTSAVLPLAAAGLDVEAEAHAGIEGTWDGEEESHLFELPELRGDCGDNIEYELCLGGLAEAL